jgi:exosortase
MLWQKKDELNTIPIKGSILGGILFFLSLCLYVIASAGGILTVTSLTLLTSFICGVWFLLGFELIRKIAFPLFFLLFMIPVPAQIYAAVTGPLQLLVTQVASLALKASSVPISCQGNVIEHPEQVFQVVQACSGLRSIMTMTTLGAVVGYFSMRTYWLRTLLILCGIPVAILVNILRVYILVGVYDWLRIDLAEGTAHTLFGVGVFVVSLGLFFLIYKWVSRWDR